MKVITIIVPSNQCHLLIKELEADYFIFKKFDNYEIMQDFSILLLNIYDYQYNLIEAALKKFEMINKQKCCLCISKQFILSLKKFLR